MATILTRTRIRGRVGRASHREARAAEIPERGPETAGAPPLDISPNDPLLAYLQTVAGPVDVEKLQLDSPALQEMREQGMKLVVPLVSQGELIGLLNLGPRLSEQEYSADDRKLLANLAAQAAPAVRVAQLVREQQAEARRRERVEHELQVAQLIQQNFLPKRTPQISGWQLAAYYKPAREVGGDFYDFIELDGGRLGVVIGDVTGKGVPAALVMAATRSILRAAAPRLVSPGEVLQRVNDVLCEDMPRNMFVTCQYGILEPETGRFVFANAGHCLPQVRGAEAVTELRATGMPLGLMPEMTYEESEAWLAPDETMVLSSDGLAESHAPDGEMYGFPRLRERMGGHAGGTGVLDVLLSDLEAFTGPEWEQEDDVTLVALSRTASAEPPLQGVPAPDPVGRTASAVDVAFEVASERGNERLVMDRVAEAVAPLGLADERLAKLKTAVAEAAMNAIEHGNEFRPDLNVAVRVQAGDGTLAVRITDHGGGRDIPEAEAPDLEAKLAGMQTPRGWGLFLIKHMVDDLRIETDDRHHTVELVVHLRGEST